MDDENLVMKDSEIDEMLARIDAGDFDDISDTSDEDDTSNTDDTSEDDAVDNTDDNTDDGADDDNGEEGDDESLDSDDPSKEDTDNMDDNYDDTDDVEDTDDDSTDDKHGDGDADSQDDDSDSEDQENNPEEKDTKEKDTKDVDTKDSDDETNQDTDKTDYSRFNEYKKFFEETAGATFMANGVEVTGHTDPKKLIQAQQMAAGYSDKMLAIKEFKPFLSALKESGMTNDPDAFNLMMNMMKGDKGAIRKHLNDLKIDPAVDLDGKIDYEVKNHVSSKQSLALDDAMSYADQLGGDVRERVEDVIGKHWDAESFAVFVDTPAVQNDLIGHISDGTYDQVMNRVAQKNSIDVSGRFGALSSIDKYKQALGELSQENMAKENKRISDERAAKEIETAKISKEKNIKAETDKILNKRKEEKFKSQAEENRKKVSNNRKKAASVSTRRKPASKPKKEVDILKLSDDDLDSFVDGLIRN